MPISQWTVSNLEVLIFLAVMIVIVAARMLTLETTGTGQRNRDRSRRKSRWSRGRDRRGRLRCAQRVIHAICSVLRVARGPAILSRMGSKSRETIYGASIRAAAERATEARKEADRLAVAAWNKRMLGFQGPAQPTPTLGDALNAGFGYLEVKCLGCDTHETTGAVWSN